MKPSADPFFGLAVFLCVIASIPAIAAIVGLIWRRHAHGPWIAGTAVVIALAYCAYLPVLVGVVSGPNLRPGGSPCPYLGCSFFWSLFLLAFSLFHTRRLPLPDKGRCKHCGYILFGLPERRCPECGQPF